MNHAMINEIKECALLGEQEATQKGYKHLAGHFNSIANTAIRCLIENDPNYPYLQWIQYYRERIKLLIFVHKQWGLCVLA